MDDSLKQRQFKKTVIRSQYGNLKHIWDLEKALRLCELLSISLDELAEFLNLSFPVLKSGLIGKKLPGPAYVLLDLWERYTYISKGLIPDTDEKLNPVEYDRLRNPRLVRNE